MNFLGGKRDEGEEHPALDTAWRELWEETGACLGEDAKRSFARQHCGRQAGSKEEGVLPAGVGISSAVKGVNSSGGAGDTVAGAAAGAADAAGAAADAAGAAGADSSVLFLSLFRHECAEMTTNYWDTSGFGTLPTAYNKSNQKFAANQAEVRRACYGCIAYGEA